MEKTVDKASISDEDFFPLEVIVKQRIKEVEEYIEELSKRIKEKPEEEYFHEQMHDAHIMLLNFKYLIDHKKDILKKCK